MKATQLKGASALTHPAIVGRPRMDAQPSLADINNLVKNAVKTFDEFKAKNDERLKEIEKKGTADALNEEHVNRINEDLGKISAKVDEFIKAQKKRTDEIELSAGRNGLNQAPGGVNYAAEAERFSRLCAAHGRAIQLDADGFKAYANAFEKMIRRGDEKITDHLRNELSVGSDADGGYFVTPQRSDAMIKRLFETSPVREHASVISISGDKYEIPLDTNQATSGGWVGEKTAPSETATPKVGMHTIETHEQFAEPHVTQKLLEDSSFPVEQWLGDKAADILGRTENTAFVTGDGVGKPRGFMSYSGSAVTTADASRAWALIQYVATGASGGFGSGDEKGMDALINLVSAMKEQLRQRALFYANRLTLAKVRKLKDGQGNYLWSMGDVQKGQPSTLLGYGTAEFEDMAAIGANSYSLAFANLKDGYQIVDRLGITLLRDPFTNKPFVKFYFRKRVGGDVVNFDAIKYLKFGTS